MSETDISTAVIKSLEAKGELNDERMAEVLGSGFGWDGEKVVAK
jgi:hypothetical protein